MFKFASLRPRGTLKTIVVTSAMALLVACTKTPAGHDPSLPFDPYEAENREVHAFNRVLDSRVVRPAGKGFSGVLGDDVETAISRFASHIGIGTSIVNNILQGNMKGATTDTYRFAVNTVWGLGGTFDVATEWGFPEATDADFGQTLYVWGVREGAYIELPVIGPSTERHAAGRIVDLFTNPLSYFVQTPESYWLTGANVASKISDRGRFSDTVDSILYESADSYAQARTIYLQNRRFKLGKAREDAYVDPYDDPYSEGLE